MVSAIVSGMRGALAAELDHVEHALMRAMEWASAGLKADLRAQTVRVLGPRVANAWREELYPLTGTSLSPAAYVYSNAPKIVSFWSADRVMTPLGAAFAIPVNPVVKRGGKPMTPVEVEAKFNAELEPRPLKSGHIGLFLNLVRAKSKRRKGFRQATKGRLSQGRETELVLMFVLVRSLRARKLIDVDGTAARWSARVAGRIDHELGVSR